MIEGIIGLDEEEEKKYMSDKLYFPPKNSIRNAIYETAKNLKNHWESMKVAWEKEEYFRKKTRKQTI